jgi:hypothetical protein
MKRIHPRKTQPGKIYQILMSDKWGLGKSKTKIITCLSPGEPYAEDCFLINALSFEEHATRIMIDINFDTIWELE